MKPVGHIIRTQDFSREFLEIILPKEVKKMEIVYKKNPESLLKVLTNRKIALLFFEKSPGTADLFRITACNLGAHVILREGDKISDEEWEIPYSSFGRTQCIEDFIVAYADLGYSGIVMRHTEKGLAARAAEAVDNLCTQKVKIINAGEKEGQHPVWALRDLYTIQKDFGKINGLSCALMGNLKKNRVINSLAYILGKFDDVKIYFISPPSLRVDRGIIEYIDRHGVSFEELNPEDLPKFRKVFDFVYAVGAPKGTMPGINLEFAHEYLKLESKVYHPFPRGDEIPAWRADDTRSQKITIDQTPYAGYFNQRKNGIPLIMTLYTMALEPETDVMKLGSNFLLK